MKHFKNITKFFPTVCPHVFPRVLYFKILVIKFSTRYLNSPCRLRVMEFLWALRKKY